MVTRPTPQYPVEAARKGLSGWVVLAYDLDGSGKGTNIRVIDSEVGNMFTAPALRVFTQTRFKEGVTATACAYLIVYRLGNEW
jgi:periplasmic protein TonB